MNTMTVRATAIIQRDLLWFNLPGVSHRLKTGRLWACFCRILFAALMITAVIGCSSARGDIPLRSYHDVGAGWKADVPVGWLMCDVPGGQFSRDLPLTDPTRLLIWTYHNQSPDEVRSFLETAGGVVHQAATGDHTAPELHWARFRGKGRIDSDLAVDFATAVQGEDTHLILLVAREAEVEQLAKEILLPALDSFVAGPPDPPASVLAQAPPYPDYWPTRGWRDATPESQGVEGAKLEALIKRIREDKLPIHSITVIRRGYRVLHQNFSPYRSGDIHELHSATKSVTSALVGMALQDFQAEHELELTIDTPVLALLSPWRADNLDTRKQALQLEHLLTMTSGLAWKEWEAAYASGTGNDLVNMIDTARDWTQYVLDRPMVAQPGASFNYNSGASYLLSTVVSRLTGEPAEDFAARELFAPLGIETFEWQAGPEGVTTGWGNLRIRPEDLARIGLLYLHRGTWEGRQIIPAEWVEASTTDHVQDLGYDYGYQWWLDLADGYAFMSGRFGQTAIVAPKQDMVIVITADFPETVRGAVSIPRWLAETYILPAVDIDLDG